MLLTKYTETFANQFRSALQKSSMPTIYEYLLEDDYFVKKI